jgi:hypothetical protein
VPVRDDLTSDELDTLESAFSPAWLPGQRHHLALALAGWLAGNGVSKAQIQRLVERLAADDEERADRLTAVDSTFATLATGESVIGFRGFNELVDSSHLSRAEAVMRDFKQRSSNGEPTPRIQEAIPRNVEPCEPIIAGVRVTDTGNAEALATRVTGRFRAILTSKTWFRFAGGRWQTDVCGSVMIEARDTILGLYARVRDADDPAERKALIAHLQHSESQHGLVAMTTLAMTDPRVATVESAFDALPGLLNLTNGTLILEGA